MKISLIRASLILFLIAVTVSCAKDDDEGYVLLNPSEERLLAGGETTIFSTSSNAFSTPAPNLSGADLKKHLEGDFHFEATFVTAPAEVNGGVGPLYNNTSCIACHKRDGRADFPSNFNDPSGFILRISIPGTSTVGGPKPVPGFGTQLQNHAIFGYTPEADVEVTFEPIVETFADGTQVILQKPIYSIVNPYMDLPTTVLTSPRLAPPVFGLGLLEEIPESLILTNQDIADSNSDGISGKANYVYNAKSGHLEIGRFGWKANVATLLEQCVAAYNGDMGITTNYFPNEPGAGQINGNDGLGDDPEISAEIVQKITFYAKTLAVPAPRNIDDPSVLRGERLFAKIDCAKCHIPKMHTGPSTISALANQIIYPYSDMLLHDMGDRLSDGRPDYLATGNEWKTRPLWGIGLTQVVNGHTRYLHDGRAKNLAEAILWHGGEALSSKNQFKALPKDERNDLIKFIQSL